MSEMDLSFTTLHGGMKQKQRDRSMHKFSAGQARVMIATDVASRGIDVDDVNCVIHFDPPDDGKAYKHRSGRTARAGSTGTVVSLVLRSQNRQYKRIQEEVGIRCKMTEPEPEALEEREFVRAPRRRRSSAARPGRARATRRGHAGPGRAPHTGRPSRAPTAGTGEGRGRGRGTTAPAAVPGGPSRGTRDENH